MANKRKKKPIKKSYFEKINTFFKTYEIYFFITSLVIFFILGIKLFQVQVSLGEDDSAYILAAKRFLEGRQFPTWHGSFYPIFLSFFLKILGEINLTFFKILNILLTAGQIVFLYFAFRRRTPSLILSLSLIFISINLYILVYASFTYSEPLYMFLQAAVIWSFLSLYDKIKTSTQIKNQIWDWLVLGLFLFLLSITRNIGWAGIIAIILFFAINKQWKEIGLSLASMAVFYIPYNLYKSIVWNIHQAGFEGQFRAIFLKNPYNPHLGYETFNGFINRFIVNSKNYLSAHLMNMLGITVSKPSIIITIIIYLAFFFTLIILWKKKRELLFPIIYVGVGVAVTFISQQTFWNQDRLILIYLPLIVILFSTALYEALKNSKLKIISPLFLILIIILSFGKTSHYAKQYQPVKEKILNGNKYYGLTPDWQHYLQAVEYAGKHIPKDELIACRKPGIAFLYGGGREFIGIYKFPDINIDTLLNHLQKEAEKKKYKIIGIVVPKTTEKLNKYYSLYPYFSYLRGFVNNFSTKKLIAIFVADTNSYEQIKKLAHKSGLIYYDNITQIQNNIVIKNKSDYGAYPDSLMKFFIDNNIKYLILGRLRKVPTNKKAGIITTVQRYINFIELKYPSTFEVIKVFGQPNDEPAYLLEIKYNKHPQLINQIKNTDK